MLDIFIKLIEKSIQLVEKRQEHKRSISIDYVEPIYTEFLDVHNNYLVSFKKYREHIKNYGNKGNKLKELIQTLYEDNLFSEHQRQSLRTFCNVASKLEGYDEINSFLLAILDYIVDQGRIPYSDLPPFSRTLQLS